MTHTYTGLDLMTLAELRREWNVQGRYLYGTVPGSEQETRIRSYLDALKAEAERRGKTIRPARKPGLK